MRLHPLVDKLLGEILLEEELVAQDALEQALTIQGRNVEREGAAGR